MYMFILLFSLCFMLDNLSTVIFSAVKDVNLRTKLETKVSENENCFSMKTTLPYVLIWKYLTVKMKLISP